MTTEECAKMAVTTMDSITALRDTLIRVNPCWGPVWIVAVLALADEVRASLPKNAEAQVEKTLDAVKALKEA